MNYRNGLENEKVTNPIYQSALEYDPITQMQNIDIQTWLKGDILLKADKMSMANSLEVRVPFLDKCVFDTASKLSMDQKVRNGTTKYMLRKAARGIVPEHVWSRKN